MPDNVVLRRKWGVALGVLNFVVGADFMFHMVRMRLVGRHSAALLIG